MLLPGCAALAEFLTGASGGTPAGGGGDALDTGLGMVEALALGIGGPLAGLAVKAFRDARRASRQAAQAEEIAQGQAAQPSRAQGQVNSNTRRLDRLEGRVEGWTMGRAGVHPGARPHGRSDAEQ